MVVGQAFAADRSVFAVRKQGAVGEASAVVGAGGGCPGTILVRRCRLFARARLRANAGAADASEPGRAFERAMARRTLRLSAAPRRREAACGEDRGERTQNPD